MNGGLGVRRDRHQGKLHHFALNEVDAALFHVGVFERAEADRDATDQARFHALPSLVYAVFQDSGFRDLRKASLERDPVLRGLVELDRPDWFVGRVLPQKRKGILELHAHRLDNIAHAVRRNSRRRAR